MKPKKITDNRARKAVETLLAKFHPNPKEEGIQDTPRRVVKAYEELTSGYKQDPAQVLSTCFDAEGYDEIVILRDVHYTSLCEHHLLRFHGTVDLAYLPGEKVVGLSKLARLVDVYALRFQIQERMTKQIADALETYLKPRGVAVIVRGEHSCMCSRGVKKEGSTMVTSAMRGAFRDEPEARAEVLTLFGSTKK